MRSPTNSDRIIVFKLGTMGRAIFHSQLCRDASTLIAGMKPHNFGVVPIQLIYQTLFILSTNLLVLVICLVHF